jgi:hypothetical protein
MHRLRVDLDDVIYPLGAALLAALFVFAVPMITGRERDFSMEFDLALLIGLVTAVSVLAALRPDLAANAVGTF